MKGSGKGVVISVIVTILAVALGVVVYFTHKNKSNNKDHFEDYAPANLTPKENEVVVALFSAGWCPHCQNYKPTWDKLKKSGDMTTSSGKRIRFVDVDCTKQAHPEAEKFKVEGYPTVVAISKSDNKHVSDRNTMEGIKGEVDSM